MKPPKLNAKKMNEIIDLTDMNGADHQAGEPVAVDADKSGHEPAPAIGKSTAPSLMVDFPYGIKKVDGEAPKAKEDEPTEPLVRAMDDERIDPDMAEFVSTINDIASDVGLIDQEPFADKVAAGVGKKPPFKLNDTNIPRPISDMPDTGGGDDIILDHAKKLSKDEDADKEKDKQKAPVVPIAGGSGFSIHFGGRNHKEVADKATSALSANEDAIKQKAKDDTGLQAKLKRLGELASRLGEMIPTEEIANKFKEIGEMISKMLESLINKITGSRAP